MKIYAIPGLGADERVFECLDLEKELIVLEWPTIISGESLAEYALRMAAPIVKNEEFIILGVSFGGVIALEMSKFLNPLQTIVVSSILSEKELPFFAKIVGSTAILSYVPHYTFLWNKRYIINWFSTKNRKLLRQILDDTDSRFVKWAMTKLFEWSADNNYVNVLRIHGDKDLIIPFPKTSKVKRIVGGGHFMIVDDAEEISVLINHNIVLSDEW